MKVRRIPGWFVRSAVRTAWEFLNRPMRYDAMMDYWRNPDDGSNRPEGYAARHIESRSEALVRLAEEFDIPREKVLEVGCNVGRNLDVLRRAGFTDLHGIDLSRRALELLGETYPELDATLYHGAIEEIVPAMEDRRFNLVFSMAVLMHIHPSMEWVFRDIARITGHTLITVEGEHHGGHRSFPRDYQLIFERHGLHQVSVRPAEGYRISHYTTRVFRREAMT